MEREIALGIVRVLVNVNANVLGIVLWFVCSRAIVLGIVLALVVARDIVLGIVRVLLGCKRATALGILQVKCEGWGQRPSNMRTVLRFHPKRCTVARVTHIMTID